MKKRVTVMLAVLVMLFVMLPGSAYAAKIITSAEINCDIDAINLAPPKKEYDVQTQIINEIQTTTSGVKISLINTFLQYWDESLGVLHGIGDGENTVNKNKQYYIDLLLHKDDGYDWPDEVKGLKPNTYFPISTAPSFRVFLNGIRRTDAFLSYKVTGSLALSIPVGQPITAKLSEDSFSYDGNAKMPVCDIAQLNSGLYLMSSGYTISYYDHQWNSVTPVNAGKYYAVIQAVKQGIYSGTTCKEFSINTVPNPMTIEGKRVKVKASKLQKKKVIVKPVRSFRI